MRPLTRTSWSGTESRAMLSLIRTSRVGTRLVHRGFSYLDAITRLPQGMVLCHAHGARQADAGVARAFVAENLPTPHVMRKLARFT